MDSRQFFTRNTWWGKVIGAFLGYLIGGPAGAIFGIFIGNFFDRGLTAHYSRPHWAYHAEKHKEVQQAFLEATFSIMGHISKANGRVSEQSIDLANTLMKELGLSFALKMEAQDYFTAGKSSGFNLKKVIVKFHKLSYNHPELLKLFLDTAYRAAKVDGLTLKKQNLLNSILGMMGFAPLHHQYRFYEDFSSDSNYQKTHQQSSNQQYHYTSHNSLEHAYGILGVSPTNTKQEIKRAYQRLMSRNHPDKLIAKGLPEEMIKKANDKTQKIRKAYEEICASKGW